jgi:hypothetical protein
MTDLAGHNHVFLGEGHEKNERRTWMVIALCSFMMVAEIVGGLLLRLNRAGRGWAAHVYPCECAAARCACL